MGVVVQNTEEHEVHTRLLRLALGIEESRAYWASYDPRAPASTRASRAFEQRWFGAKSEQRVRVLLSNCRIRYDRYPESLAVLNGWRTMQPATRRAICHWHLQLADPLYRAFTSDFLARRREYSDPTFDRDVAIRWVTSSYPSRWGPATALQFGSKLLSAASEAALITPTRDPRTPLHPKVTDEALGYLLYLLRSIEFSGSLSCNPYLSSVGIEPADLEQRLLSVPGVDYRRMIDVDDFSWQYPSLRTWAEAVL